MKNKRTQIFAAVMAAIAFALTPMAQAHPQTACDECTGGPKTYDWTGWKTLETVCGVKLQVRYLLQRKWFGTKTESNIQYRYCNHSHNDMVANLSDITLITESGQEYSFGGESVAVASGTAVEGQVWTITQKGDDKLCKHGERFHPTAAGK